MIITLCGSNRFESRFREWSRRLCLMGHPCFTLSHYASDFPDAPVTPSQKEMLDLVHLVKIQAGEAVLVLNVDGYVGESTRREVAWARMRRKKIIWLELYDGAGDTSPGVLPGDWGVANIT